MEFWDSSAVVQVVVEQEYTDSLRRKLSSGVIPWIWWTTEIECASALARLHRETKLADEEYERALQKLSELCSNWNELLPTSVVKRASKRILRVHTLKAADSLQLAAAIIMSNNNPTNVEFVSFDEKLKLAAKKEGFK